LKSVGAAAWFSGHHAIGNKTLVFATIDRNTQKWIDRRWYRDIRTVVVDLTAASQRIHVFVVLAKPANAASDRSFALFGPADQGVIGEVEGEGCIRLDAAQRPSERVALCHKRRTLTRQSHVELAL
jgi:hypothetical protein